MNFDKKLIFLALLLFSVTAFTQDLPEKPVPARLVNDFTATLKSEEINALEQKLVSFNDSTSTQIAIVIVPDLKGYDKSDYAVRLANSWGIGQKGKNNGILILVKPKTPTSNGEAFIATGYGAEGAVPDLITAEIVDNEMIPAFKVNDYYTGLESATSVIMSLIRGEYNADQYSMAKKGKSNPGPAILLILFFIIMMISSSGRNKHNSISKSGLPFWVLLGMMNSSGRSHGGSFGGFSSGGGGGFGGFGGGGFGGGGAGGSW